MRPYGVIKAAYNKELADRLFDAYHEIETNFILKKWKPSELDAGHFVEAARRVLEFELSGAYTPFSAQLPKFTDAVLKAYEQQSGHDSYRMLIPRALKAIYNIRNKRGVVHMSTVSPNEMDATLILYNVKWILAELVRLKSGLSPHETQRLMDEIVERHIPLLWKEEGVERVLNSKIKARDQVLVFLYDNSPRTAIELQSLVEYKNPTNFMKIISQLHKERLIFHYEDGNCRISPTGVAEAETILRKYHHAD